MRYAGVREAVFVRRPNRFIAEVQLDGAAAVCHVKNTGRCRELLVPGARVVLVPGTAPGRRTAWDLVAVWKGARLINMDAQAPNRVVAESFTAIVGPCEHLRPEFALGDSRFDFYAERQGHPLLAEVKGVTLEEGGVVRFPDAPTLRGLKHVTELTRLAGAGYECWVILLVQMADVIQFEPNDAAQPAFGPALAAA